MEFDNDYERAFGPGARLHLGRAVCGAMVMEQADDITAQERGFEDLIRTRQITLRGMPIAAMSDLGFPVLCSAVRSDGDLCFWPPVDGTSYCTVHVGRDYH